jgi:hypothetical protein
LFSAFDSKEMNQSSNDHRQYTYILGNTHLLFYFSMRICTARTWRWKEGEDELANSILRLCSHQVEFTLAVLGMGDLLDSG